TAQDAGTQGFGALASSGGRVELVRSTIVRAHADGFAISDDGSSGALDHSVVRGTLPGLGGELDPTVAGTGVFVAKGANASLVSSVLADNVEGNLAIYGGSATVSGTVLRGAKQDAAHFAGYGAVIVGGHADFTDSGLVANEEGGLAAVEPMTTVS